MLPRRLERRYVQAPVASEDTPRSITDHHHSLMTSEGTIFIPHLLLPAVTHVWADSTGYGFFMPTLRVNG